MRELKKNKYFSEPSLKKAAQFDDRQLGNYVQFELVCTINYAA